MRLRCLFGAHEWSRYGQVAPPPGWSDGLPTFKLRHCVHCGASSYDMVWPDGTVT